MHMEFEGTDVRAEGGVAAPPAIRQAAPEPPPVEDRTRDPRRAFFRNCLAACGAVAAGLVAAPVATFLRRPQDLEVDRAVQVGLEELKGDQAIYRDYHGSQIVIVPGKEGKPPSVFSASCTHLGCIVKWDHGTRTFQCPCHGAAFDAEGRPLKGPTNQPLQSIGFEVKDGKIVVG